MFFIFHHKCGKTSSVLRTVPRITSMFPLLSTIVGYNVWRCILRFDFVFILLGGSCTFMDVSKDLMVSILSLMFHLLNYRIDVALDRDMIISFTQETGNLRCGPLSSWMVLFTIWALVNMIFISVSYVSMDFAGLCSFHHIILEIMVITIPL